MAFIELWGIDSQHRLADMESQHEVGPWSQSRAHNFIPFPSYHKTPLPIALPKFLSLPIFVLTESNVDKLGPVLPLATKACHFGLIGQTSWVLAASSRGFSRVLTGSRDLGSSHAICS